MEVWHHITHFFSHAWLWATNYLESNPDHALWFALIVAFLEALPVVGTILPGSVTMTMIGIFAGRGIISVGETVLLTTAGAFLGDYLGYGIGRIFYDKIPNYWPFVTRPHWLENGRKFFKKHGSKSIVLGRFIGPARSTVPMVAGIFGMKSARFAIAAILSALFWSIAYLLPGVVIGAVSLQMTTGSATLFLFSGLLVAIALWFVFWLGQRCFGWLAAQFDRITLRGWKRLSQHHCWQKYTAWLAVVDKPGDASPLKRLLWAVLTITVFVFLLICVCQKNSVAGLNQPAFQFMQSLRYPVLDCFFVTVSLIAEPATLMVVTALVSLQYVLQKDWKKLLFWLLGTVAVAGMVGFFKYVVPELRPVGFNQVSHSHAFPSGHSALSTIVFGLLVYWSTLSLSDTWRSAWRVAVLLFLLLVGVSRLYLGAHWLWDVVAGWSLAAAVWLVITMLYRCTEFKTKMRAVAWQGWITLAIVATVCGGFSVLHYSRELYRTTPYWPKHQQSKSSWLQQPHQKIPRFLNNRFGHPDVPMNIQWMASVTQIQETLQRMGWHPVRTAWSVSDLLRRLTLKNAEDHLPLLDRKFQGKAPDVVYVKSIAGSLDVLEMYLWPSGVVIQPENTPVYTGFINRREESEPFYHVMHKQRLSYQFGQVALRFVKSLDSRFQYRRISGEKDRSQQQWGGDTWLILPRQQNQ